MRWLPVVVLWTLGALLVIVFNLSTPFAYGMGFLLGQLSLIARTAWEESR